MRFKTCILAIGALLLSASGASAATQTISRSGHVVATVDPGTPFYSGGTNVADISVGDLISFSATYDDADVQPLGPIYTAFGELVNYPSVSKVALGNGNPVNAVSLTIGSQSFSLSDQICWGDPVCAQNTGLEFGSLGPTLLFKGSTFLGMDSCLIQGGGVLGGGISACQLTLDNLAAFFPSLNIAQLGYTRTDLYLINDKNFNTLFIGQFDGPGIAGVPEPASWALMLGGFGLAGSAMRRGRKVSSAS